MDSEKSGEEATITIQDTKTDPKSKGKAIAGATGLVTSKATYMQQKGGWKKGAAIFDFVLRLCAITAGLAATSIMGTTEQSLPFFTQFFQFHAEYDDIETFRFFTFANGIASGYLVLSLPFSIVCIVRPYATGPRLFLIIFDSVAMALIVAAASAATAIAYLAHNGNSDANWNAICNQFTDFCQSSSSAIVASFIAAVMLLFLIILSAVALRRN
ncbi:hypothetical protein JCGZ_04188 [Jatropha curcas]|uniref:CASP-like protein n=1 Tax=Jatropha curcas TaxID=180498 RepID=A0A067KXZ9_JATCU|nr:casparian strip membrane protein 3 [Jatropha curcas]KDP39843.1 hypothetical protein JCGZ_04188 [Jatropha curcas]